MSDLFHPDGDGIPFDPVKQAQKASQPVLPKRFYKTASVGQDDGQYLVLLDGRSVKTPARKVLSVQSENVAEALCQEWTAQGEFINPSSMPLTRILNAALDGVVDQMEEVAAEISRFASSDLICYRADQPERLIERQNEHWNPVVDWFDTEHNARFALASGIIHIEQPVGAIEAVEELLKQISNPLILAALHTTTSLTGSALISIALLHGHIEVEQAWMAAHVDEDWNVELWGEDDEAKARRAYRHKEMMAATLLLRHET